MTAESNEQFHHSRDLEVTLMKYLWGTKVQDGVAEDDARESVYQESLGNMSDITGRLTEDPWEADRMLRAVMPPRFEEKSDLDPELWEVRLRLAPVELIKQGYATIDREDVGLEFFTQVFTWTLENSAGHDVACAERNECIHDLSIHKALCPVIETVDVLIGETRILYFKLHGGYTAHAVANRLDFMQHRIDAIAELFVKYGVGSQDEVDEFLYKCEDRAIVYGSQVNGLAPIEE